MDQGICSFGVLTEDPRGGWIDTARARIAQLVDLARAADAGGLDVFALGEHHRHDFPVSALEVVLATVAAKTGRIRSANAMTALSSQEPARALEQFATLDLASEGRAQILAGQEPLPSPSPLPSWT